MKRYKRNRSADRAGFYVALSICLIAVGLAVWSAYTNFSDLYDTDDTYTATLTSQTETYRQVSQDVTGVTEEETEGEEPETAPEPEEPTRKGKSITLYESPTDTAEEESEEPDAESELSSLQAVLKVTDSLIYPTKSHSVLKQYSEDAVYNKTMGDYRPHTGCDFVADEGEAVYAMCDGVVNNISSSELYGIIVEVESKNFTVYYCGLSGELNVEKGETLSTGDTIGAVSVIPCESEDESHVHIEIRVGDKLIDPLSVINSSD